MPKYLVFCIICFTRFKIIVASKLLMADKPNEFPFGNDSCQILSVLLKYQRNLMKGDANRI
ncbi:hypothetical protein C6502_01995 [Candidatus Poribacteria bacterium]|nr:MAG: hypothetical protein C6502_01995 [Candidatus Poribacteria bacterium]